MKSEIKRLTNRLLLLLEICGDEELADEVCANVSCNTPFDEEEIEEV